MNYPIPDTMAARLATIAGVPALNGGQATLAISFLLDFFEWSIKGYTHEESAVLSQMSIAGGVNVPEKVIVDNRRLLGAMEPETVIDALTRARVIHRAALPGRVLLTINPQVRS